jgi:hypothetical protein
MWTQSAVNKMFFFVCEVFLQRPCKDFTVLHINKKMPKVRSENPGGAGESFSRFGPGNDSNRQATASATARQTHQKTPAQHIAYFLTYPTLPYPTDLPTYLPNYLPYRLGRSPVFEIVFD